MKINSLKVRNRSIEFVSSDILSVFDKFKTMLNKSNIIILLLLLSILLNSSTALRISDDTNSIETYRILSKFIFIPMSEKDKNGGNTGNANIKIYHNHSKGTLWLLGFSTSYEKVISYTTSDCGYLIQNAAENNWAFKSTTDPNPLNPSNISSEFNYLSTYNLVKNFGGYSYTYWMLLNCQYPFLPNSLNPYSTGPLRYKIEAHFTNAVGGLDAEFSYDEIGLLQLNVVFFSLHMVLLVYAWTVHNHLLRFQKLHPTAELLFWVLCVMPLKYLIAFAFFHNYSRKGKSSIGVLSTSFVVDSLVTAMFICLILLLASGWGIFRRKLPALNRLRMTFFVSMYTILGFASAFWLAKSDELEFTYTYYYTSGPGILMLVLLFLVGVRFLVNMTVLMDKFKLVPPFYKWLRGLGAFYIFSLPLITILSLGAEPVNQFKIISSFWNIINFIFQLLVLFIYDPRLFPEIFPFHDFNSIEHRSSAGGSSVAGIGFSGGSLALVDEDGKFRALNKFDKMHLSRLKDISKSITSEITTLNTFQTKFESLLDKIASDSLQDQGLNQPSSSVPVWASPSSSTRRGRGEQDPNHPSFNSHEDDEEDDDDDDSKTVTSMFKRGKQTRWIGDVSRGFRPLSKTQMQLEQVDKHNGDDNDRHTSSRKSKSPSPFPDTAPKELPTALELALQRVEASKLYKNSLGDFDSENYASSFTSEPKSEIISLSKESRSPYNYSTSNHSNSNYNYNYNTKNDPGHNRDESLNNDDDNFHRTISTKDFDEKTGDMSPVSSGMKPKRKPGAH